MIASAQPPALRWTSEREFTIGATTFVATPGQRFESTVDRFCLVKRPELVAQYVDLVTQLRPRTILELGIFAGGSTAFLAAFALPDKLVAIDIKNDRVSALDEFIARYELDASVRAYFGVDQSDADRMREIVDSEFGSRPLDLVVDDASHDIDLTRASFNVLFPRLAEGGAYIVEDWSWAHIGFGSHRKHDAPLTTLVFELVMACPSQPGLITSVTIDRNWALIRRGSLAVDPHSFDISQTYSERGRALLR